MCERLAAVEFMLRLYKCDADTRYDAAHVAQLERERAKLTERLFTIVGAKSRHDKPTTRRASPRVSLFA